MVVDVGGPDFGVRFVPGYTPPNLVDAVTGGNSGMKPLTLGPFRRSGPYQP